MLNATQLTTNSLQSNLRLNAYDVLSGTRNTILVVEDEAFVRDAACDILEHEGYRVLRAANAMEAQAAFNSQPGNIQLLLSDVVLPGQNGLRLAKDLQAAHPALKTIFISGYPENIVTRYGLTTGEGSYLSKPFSGDSLLGRVRQVLELQKSGCR